jgi:AcrR family transcriptional regulator
MPYPAKISRAAILKYGLRVVEKEGIEALSLRAVARKLKVAVNALYNYFPNRSALESAIGAEGYKVLHSYLMTSRSGRPGAATLHSYCKAYLNFARAHRRLFALMSRKRPPGTESAAINAELTSLIIRMRGSRPGKDQAAKVAFTVLAMLKGIIATEQQMHPPNPTTYSNFAIAVVISEITRARGMKKTLRQARNRSGKFGPNNSLDEAGKSC